MVSFKNRKLQNREEKGRSVLYRQVFKGQLLGSYYPFMVFFFMVFNVSFKY